MTLYIQDVSYINKDTMSKATVSDACIKSKQVVRLLKYSLPVTERAYYNHCIDHDKIPY